MSTKYRIKPSKPEFMERLLDNLFELGYVWNPDPLSQYVVKTGKSVLWLCGDMTDGVVVSDGGLMWDGRLHGSLETHCWDPGDTIQVLMQEKGKKWLLISRYPGSNDVRILGEPVKYDVCVGEHEGTVTSKGVTIFDHFIPAEDFKYIGNLLSVLVEDERRNNEGKEATDGSKN